MSLKIVVLCLFLGVCYSQELQGLNETVNEDLDDRNILGTGHVVQFLYYNRQRPNIPEIMEVDSKNGKVDGAFFPSFVTNKPTKVIIHGWKGSDEKLYATLMRESILKHLDVNLIVVDWSKSGSKLILYPMAKAQVPKVARVVAEFLDNLSRRGVKLENVHVLGHSLGAHVAGIAGNLVKTGKIGRITGLDPAGPGFSDDKPSERLSPSSASFVDVIHTCGKYLGFSSPIGHADFFPNGGHFIQPGCGVDVAGSCSHRRSYRYYVETLSKRDAFPALSCPSWDDFKNKRNCGSRVTMGEGLNQSARGKFFLATNSKEPFVGQA